MNDISKGYIALYRQFIDWEWFTDVNVCHLFQYCLLRANYKDTKWRGIEIKKGQFVTSYEKLSIDTGLTVMQIRTALNKLKTTGEITHQTTSRNSIITVNNWKFYQEDNKQITNKLTDKQQTNNKQITTDNKDNKENNISNISYINISLSNKKITKEEREILRNYLLRQKRKPDNPEAYIKTLIKNGDWVEIVEKEKKRLLAKEEKKKQEEQKNVEEVITPEDEKEIEQIQKRIRENFKKRRTN